MADRTPNRISDSDTSTESHERTNVRTEKSERTVNRVTKVDARGSDNDFAAIDGGARAALVAAKGDEEGLG